MRTVIEAETETLAREFIKNIVVIHKIKKQEDETLEHLKDIFGMKD